MLPSADKEKTYRVDGGIAWYKSLLPAFDSQPLTTIINNLVSQKDGRAIKILDLGAGNFTFARECRQKWPQVQVTGVSKVDYGLLEQKLREIGYEVYQLSKPLKTFPDMLTHHQTPLPITPVPATERNVYLEALKRLQTELSLPSQQVFMDHGIAFRKTSGLENLGEAIVKLLNNHSGLARG